MAALLILTTAIIGLFSGSALVWIIYQFFIHRFEEKYPKKYPFKPYDRQIDSVYQEHVGEDLM